MEKIKMKTVVEDELSPILEYARENNVPVLRNQTAKILELVTDLVKPLEILEIGTAIGYSGSLMLKSGDPNSNLTTIEKDADSYKIAKENFAKVGLKNRVTLFNDDAIVVLPKLTKKFDLIFLDGPKGQYIKYLPFLLSLLSPNGVMVADNVLYRGMILDDNLADKRNETIVKRMREFLLELQNNPILKTIVLEIEDGVSITLNKGVYSKLVDKMISTSRLSKN